MDSLTQYFSLPGKGIKLNTMEAEAAHPAVVLYTRISTGGVDR